MDGPSRDDRRSASCGGLIRDVQGNWVTGFNLNLDPTDGLSAKIQSIVEGLKLAWETGCQRVHLESDSKRALDLVKKGCSDTHPLKFQLRKIEDLRRKDWELKLG